MAEQQKYFFFRKLSGSSWQGKQDGEAASGGKGNGGGGHFALSKIVWDHPTCAINLVKIDFARIINSENSNHQQSS